MAMGEISAQAESGNGRTPELRPRGQAGVVTHIFFILFCLEIGLVLVLLPWTLFWDNNYFFSLTPGLGEFWLSTYLRGGVSGVGFVNLWIGISEAWNLWR